MAHDFGNRFGLLAVRLRQNRLHHVVVKVPAHVLDELDRLADRWGLKRGEALERLIRDAMKNDTQ